uniref:Putative secreted protein n=1 Tax=Ixodes ricinus TaxID=34613 RepID=A0A6B0U8H2_IXORI
MQLTCIPSLFAILILEAYIAARTFYGVPRKALNLDVFLGFGFLSERIYAPELLAPGDPGAKRTWAILLYKERYSHLLRNCIFTLFTKEPKSKDCGTWTA